MVVYNAASKELTAKIVYYGPGLSGKTTNIQFLHGRLEPSSVGNLMTLAATQDRTIYFDLLPVELGDIKGYRIRFQVATVPGQIPYNETRRLVLRGVDGVVFVVDSRWSMLPKNVESLQNLRENLKEEGISFEGLPFVIQFNKRDLPDVLAVDALQEALGIGAHPFIEATASEGKGVIETFKLISKLTFVDILRRLQKKESPKPPKTDIPTLTSWKNAMVINAANQAVPPDPLEEAAPEGVASGSSPSLTTPVLRPVLARSDEPLPDSGSPGVTRAVPIRPFTRAAVSASTASASSSLESPFESAPFEDTNPAIVETEVVFEAPPELPTLPPSREETNPAYFPAPAAPASPPPLERPKPLAAPKASSGTTASLELSKLLAERQSPRPQRTSREAAPAAPTSAPTASEPGRDKGMEELDRRLSVLEGRISGLEERSATTEGAQAKADQDREQADLARREAEKVGSEEREELASALERETGRLDGELARLRAERRSLEETLGGLVSSVKRLQEELAEMSARETESVARSNRDSMTFQAMVEKLNFGIIENESRLNEVAVAHESRISRTESLLEDLGRRLGHERESLRRLVDEAEERIKLQREDSDRRLAGIEAVRESLAAALSELAEKLR